MGPAALNPSPNYESGQWLLEIPAATHVGSWSAPALGAGGRDAGEGRAGRGARRRGCEGQAAGAAAQSTNPRNRTETAKELSAAAAPLAL